MAPRGPASPLRAAGDRRGARGRPFPGPLARPRRPGGSTARRRAGRRRRADTRGCRRPVPCRRDRRRRTDLPLRRQPRATWPNTLRGTRVWAAIREAWRDGASLAGCSAGAMALGGYVPDFRHPKRGGTDGLGAVPDLRVLPHFDKYSRMIPDFALQAARHAGRHRRGDRRGHRAGVGGPVGGRPVGVPFARSAVGVDDRGRPPAPRQRAAATARRRVSQPTPRADLRQQGPPGVLRPGIRTYKPRRTRITERASRALVEQSAFVLDPAAPALDLAGDLGRRHPRRPGDRVRGRTRDGRDGRGGPGDRHPGDRRPHARSRRPPGAHRRGRPHQRAGHGVRRTRACSATWCRGTRSPACAATSPTRGRRPVITSAGSSSPTSLDLVRTRLVPGGTWHIATDWEEYAAAITACFSADARWHGGVIERPPWRPVTRYERRALADGRAITDLVFATSPTD